MRSLNSKASGRRDTHRLRHASALGDWCEAVLECLSDNERHDDDMQSYDCQAQTRLKLLQVTRSSVCGPVAKYSPGMIFSHRYTPRQALAFETADWRFGRRLTARCIRGYLLIEA